MKNLIEELKWRGLIQDIMPGTEEQLTKEMTTGYVGFDPTADSYTLVVLCPLFYWFTCKNMDISLLRWLAEPQEWLATLPEKVKKEIC